MAMIDELLARLDGKATTDDPYARLDAAIAKANEPEKPDYVKQAILAFSPALFGAVAGGPAGAQAAVKGSEMVNQVQDDMRKSEADRNKNIIELEAKRAERAIAAQKDIRDRAEKAAQREQDLKRRADERAEDMAFRKSLAEMSVEGRREAAADRAADREEKQREKKEEKELALVVPGFERTGAVLPKAEEAQKFRKAVATSDQLQKKINRMKELVEKRGSFEWGGDDGTEMSSLATEIQLLGKSPELYELGVLTGPDLSLLEKITADPSSWTSLFTKNSSRMKQLDSQLKSIGNKLDSTAYSLGYKRSGQSFPMTVRKGNQRATVKDEAELKEAQSEGWSP